MRAVRPPAAPASCATRTANRIRFLTYLVLAGMLLGLAVFPALAAPGSLDTSFGSGGIVKTVFGTVNDEAQAIAVQADGKIVAAGYSTVSRRHTVFALARYNTDGSLDTGFDSDGKVTTFIHPGPECNVDVDQANGVAIQSDGKILAAGFAKHCTVAGDFALVRYNANGSLDQGFGSGGAVTTAFGSGLDDYA